MCISFNNKFLIISASLSKQKLKRNNNMTFFDAKTGVYTHYKPFLHKDKSVIRRLIKGLQVKRPPEVQTAILRRHLLELTHSFIIPLERYMSTLMPLKKNISPYKVGGFLCSSSSLLFPRSKEGFCNGRYFVFSECSSSVTI